MLLFLMDVDFGCDWILIQIFYVHRFVGKDADACNQHLENLENYQNSPCVGTNKGRSRYPRQ